MRNTPFDARSSEWIGDMTVWLRENSEDNGLCLERLRRNLRLAREQELTPCQRQVLELRYDQNMSVTQIARQLGGEGGRNRAAKAWACGGGGAAGGVGEAEQFLNKPGVVCQGEAAALGRLIGCCKCCIHGIFLLRLQCTRFRSSGQCKKPFSPPGR